MGWINCQPGIQAGSSRTLQALQPDFDCKQSTKPVAKLRIAAKFGRIRQTNPLPKLPSWLLGTGSEGPGPAEVPSIVFAGERGGVSGAGLQGAVGHDICPRRLNIEPPCRSNIEPGRVAGF